VVSPEVTQTPPIIFSAVRCQVSHSLARCTFQFLFLFSQSVPTFCRGRYEDRISYYLLGGGVGGGGGSRLGWTWTGLLRKHWFGSDKAASGTFALKPFCRREVQFQAIVFLVISILELVSFAHRTFSLSSTPGALCVPGAALAFCYTAR
jgi:hypothetical protein